MARARTNGERPREPRLSRLRIPAVLAAIVLVSAAVRLWLASRTAAPWVIPDELVYSELAQSFGESGRFEIREGPWPVWSFGPLYPMLLAGVYALVDDLYVAYAVAKAVNCVIWSTAAVPAYFLARRILNVHNSLGAAALTLIVPAGIYTTKLMTESLAYPAFLLAFLTMVMALERPSIRRQVAALAAIAVAALARGQLVALLPALWTATVVVATLGGTAGDRGRAAWRMSVGRFWPTWAATGLAAAGGAAVHLSDDRPVAAAAGRGIVSFEQAALRDLAGSLLHHLAILDLHVGVVPAAAFVVVVAAVLSQRTSSPSQRAFAAASVSALLWLPLVAAVYLTSIPPSASGVSARVYDRYVFYLAPLLLISLLAYCSRAVSRPGRRWEWAAAAAAGALPATLPLGGLLYDREWGTSSSTVALVPWALLRLVGGQGAVVPTVVAFGAALGAMLLLARHRPAAALTAAVVALLVVGGSAHLANHAVAGEARRAALGDDPGWIDAAVGRDADVVAIWAGLGGALDRPIWGHEIFNRSVGRVYHVGPPLRYAAAGGPASLQGEKVIAADGSVVDARYVLTDSLGVVGRRVAADARTGLLLYEVEGSLRVSPARGAAADR